MAQQKITNVKKFLKRAAAVAVLQAGTLPLAAFAAEVDNSDISVKVPTDLKLSEMLGKVRDYLFGIVLIACVFMVLWGAFDLVFSGGDETKVSNAKKRIMYAAIGLVVAAMAMAIVGLLRTIVNV